MRRASILPSRILLWAVAALTAVLYIFMPLSGDDYSYLKVWHYPNIFQAILHYPGYIKFHWLTTNGRMANYLAPPLLNLIPKWVFALLCGAATWLMLYMSLRWSGLWRRGGFWSTLLIAVVMLAFPWWDSMQLFDCQLNYIWASGLVLAGLWVVVRPTPVSESTLWLCAALAFFGGMMHESASIPLVAGLIVWRWIHRQSPMPKGRGLLLALFIAGAVLAVTSPNIFNRAKADYPPDDTLTAIFLTSFSIVGIFWITLAVMACRKSWREIMMDTMSTPLLILSLATVPTVIIGLRVGVVGRTGWFGSLFALIVMLYMWRRMAGRLKFPRLALCGSWLLVLVVTAHLCGTIYCQIYRGAEHEKFLQMYLASPDGVVYFDYQRDTELPWWTLNRTRGVPDADDRWNLHTLAIYRDWAVHKPVILPTDARPAVERGHGTTVLKSGDIITDSLPSDAFLLEERLEAKDALLYVTRHTDGSWWTVQMIPSTNPTLYHLTPLILDPGDRLPAEIRD